MNSRCLWLAFRDYFPIHSLMFEESGRHHQVTSDIVFMFVNVYGSKEFFVNEYRTLLAKHLLSQYSYDTEKEIC